MNTKIASLSFCAATVASVLLFAGLPPAIAQGEKDAPAAEANAKLMRFHVLDATTGQPVDGVKVRAWVSTSLATDAKGSCAIPLPRPTSENFSYRITVTKDGYVTKTITWSKARQDKVEDMPADYSTKMEKAASIGGVLKNQDGQPLAGARILFSGIDPADPSDRERTTIAPNYHVERTDENGKWQCNHVPAHFEDMTFRVVAPDYAAVTFGCAGSSFGGPEVVRLPASEFLSGNAAMVMGHGIVLSGQVVDSAGKPAANVGITLNHEWRNPSAVLQTDAEGRFKIPNLHPGDMILTFEPKGFAPQTLALTATNPMPEVKVELKPGNILKGRVLDEEGKPIAGASVQMDRVNLQPLEFDWSTTTDAEGRFLWDSAPAETHPYLVSAEGFNLKAESGLLADGADKIITLHKATGKTVIDGRLTDMAGNTPINKFTILVRVSNEHGVTNFEQEVANADGAYSVAVDQHATAFTLEMRAPGYLPARTELKSPGDGDQQLNMGLQKGAGIAGVMVWVDGTPVADTELALCTETDGAEIGSHHLQDIYRTNVTATGADGSFVFAPLAGSHTIYAANDRGFAELDLTDAEPPYRVKLLPWGTIEGTAMAGGKPLAGAEMAVEGALPNPVAAGLSFAPLEYTAKTDAEGKFVISNVPPTELRVGQIVNGMLQNARVVSVIPGRPTEVQYGGTGRLVTGRFELPGYTGKINWTAGQSITMGAVVPLPDMPDFANAGEKKKWINEFWRSDAGRIWRQSQRAFTTTPEADGSFKIADVPPGKYQLVAQVRDIGGEKLGTLSTNITVTQADPGAATAMDLAALAIQPAAHLRVGDVAPVFETVTTSGQALKLVDFRGKYVLVDFWATWCGPCVAEMPNLKSVYEKFGKDSHFAMMSLSVDAASAQPIEFARKNEIHWIQGFLGEWKQSPVPDMYGVEGIPAIFLIGPDGKIVGRDLRGPAIGEAIARALGSN